jgi:MFS family permease
MKVAFRLLPYFYLLLAALVLVSLVLVVMSIGALYRENVHQPPNPHDVATRIVLLLIAMGLATVYILNAIFLLRKARRKTSIILSLISCIGFPLGTILGAISLFVLTRNTIKNEFPDPARKPAHRLPDPGLSPN